MFCENCGAKVEENAAVCTSCGAPVNHSSNPEQNSNPEQSSNPNTGYTSVPKKYCKNCGAEMDPNAAICTKCGFAFGTGNSYCQNCGVSIQPGQAVCINCGTPVSAQGAAAVAGAVGGKSKVVAGLLAIFLGTLGIHNFYLGYTGKAVAQLLISVLSCGILAIVSEIWALIEGIFYLTSHEGYTTDAKGNALTD